ncbi:hypothetical protein LTR94_033993, partial [Friedmanniomyces endolithicus]
MGASPLRRQGGCKDRGGRLPVARPAAAARRISGDCGRPPHARRTDRRGYEAGSGAGCDRRARRGAGAAGGRRTWGHRADRGEGAQSKAA